MELTNPLGEEKGWISVELNFLDASGTVVGSGSATFENLAAGQKARGEATAFDLADGAEVASCEVADATVL